MSDERCTMTDHEWTGDHIYDIIHRENAVHLLSCQALYVLSTRIIPPRSKASSPGSVASKVCDACTHVTTGADTGATAGAGNVWVERRGVGEVAAGSDRAET